jgi:fatty acid desaturase
MDIVIKDPKWVKPERHSVLERAFFPLMKDERDLIFINVSAIMTVTVVPMAALMFLCEPWVVALAALPYIGIVFLNFGGRYGLMLHAVGHRPIFRDEYRFVQNYIPWVLGPLMGHTPTSFEAHHMWMHHAENNMLGDGSATLPYQRDRIDHFGHYFIRFFIMGHVHLVRYLRLRGRHRTANRFIKGELAWLCLALFSLWLNWAAALVVIIGPMMMMRFLMMAGNFAQHSFVDMSDPDNPYKNSNNLINAKYNQVAYNDGYHIVHHLKPGMHWTDMAQYFEDNIQDFIDEGSTIFDGLDDNLHVWFLLMTRNYDKLARHLVDFEGRSHEEKIAFLQERTRSQVGQIPAIFRLESADDVRATDRKTGIPVEQALVAQ